MKDDKSEMKKTEAVNSYDAGMRSLTRCLQGAFMFLVLLMVCVIGYYIAFSGGFRVESQKAVLVFRFGKNIGSYDSGWHWYLPYPITDKVVIDTTVKKLKVDFLSAVDGKVEQARQPVLAPGADQYLITGDNNIIHEAWEILYRVTDPVKYYTNCLAPIKNAHLNKDDDVLVNIGAFEPVNIGPRGPQTLLSNLLRSTVVMVSAETSIDNIMYENRNDYSDKVAKLFAKRLADLDVGIGVNEVNLVRIVEPGITARAFKEVTQASQRRAIASSQANEYRTKTRQEALAIAAELESAAKTYANRLVYDLEAEVKLFNSIREMTPENRRTALISLYTSTVSDVLDGVRDKYVISKLGKGEPQVRIKLNEEQDAPKTSASAER